MDTTAAVSDWKRALESAGCSLARFLSHSDCRVETIDIHGSSQLEKSPQGTIWEVRELSLVWKSLLELEKLGECMYAIGTSSTCRRLRLSDVVFTPDELSRLCDGLVSNQTLESLEIKSVDAAYDDDVGAEFPPALKILHAALDGNESLHSVYFWTVNLGSHPGSLEQNGLVSALSRENCKIDYLGIVKCSGLSHDVLMSVATCLGKTNKSLRTLSFFALESQLPDEFSSMLLLSTTLVFLTLGNFVLDNSQLIQFFKSLENNASLEVLLMHCGDFNEDGRVIAHLLDSLQINGILHQLYFRWNRISSHSNAALDAQLARNRKDGEHIKKLKKSQPKEKVPPTTSRLLICGEPYAGKSMLSNSLAKIAHSRRKCITSCTCFVPDEMPLKRKRTRGIEITFLCQDNLKVSVWDLAGQLEFHSFHDHMFPNLSNQASPSFFLFVWNPIEMSANGIELIHRKSREKFQSEFKYWLKFIVSKTRRSEVLKPRLIVVLSRKDRMAHGESIESWLGDSLTNLQRSFSAFIDVEGIFEVDARDPSSVKEVYSCIFKTANKVLRSGVPPVYVQCEQVRTLLSNRLRTKINMSPLITFTKFKTWCRKLGIVSSDLQEAIALSLNDSGDLVYLKSMDFVVVDTRWFCHRVMGNLIYYSGPGKGTGPLLPAGNAEHGFFSLEYLKSLLEREAKSASDDSLFCFNRRKIRSLELMVEGGDLVKLLLGLRLACRKDVEREDSEIFIPACLPESDNLRSRWRQDIGDDREKPVVFLGRRLKCQDSDLTFITPGVFNSLQVALYKKFAVNVYPEKNSISLIFEGVEVLVEFCRGGGEDPFIDILVRSHLDFNTTLKKVHERVIDEIVQMCAEPSGIQGTELVEAVVRPSCVRGPSTVDERREQDVPIEDLQKQLEKEVQEEKPAKLSAIMHSWKSTDRLPSTSDRVIDLLGEAAVRNVYESHEGQLCSAGYALGILEDKGVDEAEPSFKRTLSGKERELIFRRVGNVEGQIKEMRRTLEEIAASIEGLHKQVLPRLEKAMEELETFLKEGEGGRVPRMPVVTGEKEGWGRRVISTLLPSLHEVRLELLCEHRLQPHFVNGHPGLRFATLDDGLLKQALPYATAFLKLANVAVKATAHITLGLGHTIPDFTKVLALLVDTSDVPPLPQLHLPAVRLDSQATTQWLFNFLSKPNCPLGTHIYETFRLQRVRYADQRVAWLCDDHYPEGTPYPA